MNTKKRWSALAWGTGELLTEVELFELGHKSQISLVEEEMKRYLRHEKMTLKLAKLQSYVKVKMLVHLGREE